MYDFCCRLKHLLVGILFHNLRHPYIPLEIIFSTCNCYEAAEAEAVLLRRRPAHGRRPPRMLSWYIAKWRLLSPPVKIYRRDTGEEKNDRLMFVHMLLRI